MKDVELQNKKNIKNNNSLINIQPALSSDTNEIGNIINKNNKISKGCMKCGSTLKYLEFEIEMECCFCGKTALANARCEKGHFICDSCHSEDAEQVIKRILLATKEIDTIKLMNTIRQHNSMPLHGPEHHFTVPGVIVATYRNLGGDVGDNHILTAIERGKKIPGGACGFWGGCGAALGTGIGFGVIMGSNPLDPQGRKLVQGITGEVINGLSDIEAARCCQREVWKALKIAAEISKRVLSIPLQAKGSTTCHQMALNKECPGLDCPWFKKIKE